jgi:hypothetical protein
VSKPSPKELTSASWIVAVVILAALGVAVAGGLRMHRGTASAHRAAAAPLQAPALRAEDSIRVRASMGTLPLAFEANQGQTDPQVKYMARGNGYTVFLTANDTVFALHSSSQAAATRVTRNHGLAGTTQPAAAPAAEKDRTAAIHMHLIGGNPQSQIIADSKLPGRSNYFIGNDRSQWHADVAQYARISYRDAYPGVTMAFYGVQKQLEFDLIVAPGAIPAAIRLGVTGANRIATDHSGNLILASSVGDVLLHKPVAYQQKDGAREPVDARFVLQSKNQVSFELGDYDRSRELVIDPSVTYATYLGGTAEDDGNAIAIDGSGNAYVTGQTKSTNFPTKNALHATNTGGFDVFVTELSATGSLVYSTYIGGTGDDSGNAIAVDASGDAFVAGGTNSSDFPTHGAYQSAFGGVLDAFVLELTPTGSALTYSTFLGGTGSDVATGIALATDASGDTFVVGSTGSTNFPKMAPIQSAIVGTSNGFVTKLNSSGSALVYSTYLGGGSGDFAGAVAVDSSDNAYVTGGTKNKTFPVFPLTTAFQTSCGTDGNCNGGLFDAFVSVINSSGSGFVYSTFLGGESNDEGLGIAVDSAGDAYVTGFTSSTAFKLSTSPLQAKFGGGSLPTDAFVTELNPTGTGLIYSTYLGGSGDDTGLGIAVDSNKNAYVTGETGSPDFPTASATQSQKKGQNDAFVSEISAGGSALVFSTYLGGSLNENTASASGRGSLGAIAVDTAGANIYVTGSTTSTDFPTVAAEQPAAGGTGDAFVAKYSTSGTNANFTVTNGALSPTSGSPGVSATATITVTSTNSFGGAVTLACSVAPVVPKAPTCSFSNPGASVTLPANGSVTATLNLATTAASALLERPSDRRSSGVFYAMLLPIGAITLLGAGLGSAGSRRRKLFGFLMLGLLLTTLLLIPACSSSNSGGGGGSTGTPTGPYTITVTGTNNSAVATGSPALVLTVN